MNDEFDGLFCVCGRVDGYLVDELAGFLEHALGREAGAHGVQVGLKVAADAAVFLDGAGVQRDGGILAVEFGEFAVETNLLGFHFA